MSKERKTKSFKMLRGESQKGQVIIEYVLILVIAVSVALAFVELVDVGDGQNPDTASSLIKYWRSLITEIGKPLDL